MTVAGKPISNYRIRTRQAPPSPSRRLAIKPPLWEFVLLSILLHTTAILLFGAPSGGSREGRAMWGALQVVLQGAPVDAGPSLKIDRGLGRERGEASKKTAPVPRVIPKPSPEPIAPLLKLEPRVESLAPASEPAPLEVPPVVIPPLLDRIAAPDRTPELTPFRLPPPTPVQAAPPPTPAPVMQPVPLPVPLPERVFTPPAEISPVASPVIPALPATPPVMRPAVEVPALPVPTTESVAPPRIEPAPKPAEVAPMPDAAVAVPAAPANVAQPIQRREAPARVERAPAIPSSPFAPSGPAIDSNVNRAGDPGTKYDPTAPSLDLEAMRQRAGEMARSGSGNRALLPFAMPPVPPKKSKMETAIENARKPDCRTAYAQLGLAAVVPLIANEFGEGNCRW